jgi:hypothetical protein
MEWTRSPQTICGCSSLPLKDSYYLEFSPVISSSTVEAEAGRPRTPCRRQVLGPERQHVSLAPKSVNAQFSLGGRANYPTHLADHDLLRYQILFRQLGGPGQRRLKLWISRSDLDVRHCRADVLAYLTLWVGTQIQSNPSDAQTRPTDDDCGPESRSKCRREDGEVTGAANPFRPDWRTVGGRFSVAMRTTNFSISSRVRGRPGPRCLLPSYLWAINFRCHVKSVSGVTMLASSFSMCRPSFLALAAKRLR